jgi:hypothetical protein
MVGCLTQSADQIVQSESMIHPHQSKRSTISDNLETGAGERPKQSHVENM